MIWLGIKMPSGKFRQWMFASEWEVYACINAMQLIHGPLSYGFG